MTPFVSSSSDGLFRPCFSHVIRHPLYAAEILAILSFAMLNPTLSIVALLAPFIATQLLRARYEEGLLMRVFPSYRTYASHTCRLIPFVW